MEQTNWYQQLKSYSGNWIEDFSHENGNYGNVCSNCKHHFLGHKRRRICKNCMTGFVLSPRQEALFAFIKNAHGTQLRKYTNEPYWVHLLSVAKIVSKYESNCIEKALGHDLFEDTDCTKEDLFEFLTQNEYSPFEANLIIKGITNLTDSFTKENYPELNRGERKRREAERLGNIPPEDQSIKYADLMDNTPSIVKYDPEFAEVYLKEKIQILDVMRKGNINLLIDCCFILKSSFNELTQQQLK